MKKIIITLLLLILQSNLFGEIIKIDYGNFGLLTIYKNNHETKNIVFFISGDGGWNSRVENMANKIINDNTLLIGIDKNIYFDNIYKLRSSKLDVANDLKNTKEFIFNKFKINKNLKPVLIGYSSGATLVYIALTQSKVNSYKGAISLGFTPKLESNIIPSKGEGLRFERTDYGFKIIPKVDLNEKLFIIHGMKDDITPPYDAIVFAEQIKKAKIIKLFNVDHYFDIDDYWSSQFINAFNEIITDNG